MSVNDYTKAVIAEINAKHVNINGTALAARNQGAIGFAHMASVDVKQVAASLVKDMKKK